MSHVDITWVEHQAGQRLGGHVANLKDAVFITGPRDGVYRVTLAMRWKDIVVRKCMTMDEAKREAEKLVSQWLDDAGLTIARH